MFKLQILYYFLRLKCRPSFKNQHDLKNYQNRKWRKYVRFLKSKSPYYAQFKEGKWQMDRNHFPQINKQQWMEHFSEINTVGLPKEEAMHVALNSEQNRDFSSDWKGITVGLSTGTSGNRGLFLASKKERAQWVAAVLDRVVDWKPFAKRKVAFFLRSNSNLYTSVNSSVLKFHYFDLMKPFDQLTGPLQELQPEILSAPPGVLLQLANLKMKGTLAIAPLQVISYAEVLEPGIKKIIEQAFNTTIKEVYQCTEGFLGTSCTEGTLHLNEDFCFIDKQFIDEASRKFIPIVTDFTRRSQPVVRYELTDVLTLKETPCTCGSPFLAIQSIEGRKDDLLIFPRIDDLGTEHQIHIFPDGLIRKIALEMDQYVPYRILMEDDRLYLQLQNEEERKQYGSKMAKAITDYLSEHGVNRTIEIQTGIDLAPGEKFRRIIKR